MTKLEDNAVPIIVLDDDDDDKKSEISMGGSAFKLADSQVQDFDIKKDEDGEGFTVPTIDKAVEAENIITNSGKTISVDGLGVKVSGYASLNGSVVSEQKNRDNERSYSLYGKSEEHGFIVGDLVWCKIKSHPWLPAQVYDSKDASEFALKYSQEGRLLVAFFGDGSCSWCLPSQLKHFVENFVEMSRVCNSKSSVNAVQKAVNEFGRIVESDMICKCIAEDQRGGLARPVAENAAVKFGVLVPEVDVHRLSVPKYEPYKVLAKVRHFAKTVSIGNELHLEILKCWISALNRFKGGYQLPLYCEPICIEGLDEKKRELNPAGNDFSAFSSDIVNYGRKMETLAELMGEKVKVGPKSEVTFSVGKKSRKRKVESLESHKIKSENVEKITVSMGLLSRKEEEIEVTAGETKQELYYVFTPRERKKSKYLSPPFTNLIGKITRSSSFCKPISKCVNEASEQILLDQQLNMKMPFPLSDVEMPVNELLSKIQFAAVNHLYVSNDGSFDKAWAFVSTVRSSTYLHGSNYKTYRKCLTGKKKKPLPSQPKLSSTVRRTPIKMESSCTTDDFTSDVRSVTRKLEIMTVILEKYHTKFSVNEKASLKEDIKQIMENVESVSEKVEIASDKVRMAEETSSRRN